MRLLREDRQMVLVEKLELANSFWTRAVGLLGRSGLDSNSGLWIRRCNSVHTFFMRFNIDVIFIDKDLVIRKLKKNVRPGRFLAPVWKASSVMEFQNGFIEKHRLTEGEKLYVDHSIS